MRYTGRVFWSGHAQPDATATAILTETRLALDWVEEGGQGHLESTSVKGDLIEGRYEYQGWDGQGQYLLRTWRSGSDVLLFGSWVWQPTQEEGTWAFVLSPES
jgi:hypothetical protein